ncbi:hypothetical protein D3C81_1016400 [compost metagenome]
MTAVQLHAKAGDFLTAVGKERFDQRDQQRGAAGRRVSLRRSAGAVFKVQLPGGVGCEHATAFTEGLLGQQHAPHIRVNDDRVSRFVRRHRATDRARLQALAGISQAALERCFGDAQALQPDLKTRIVHHREHARQAMIRLPHQPAAGSVEVHHTGGGTLDAHLVLQRPAAHGVAFTQRAIGVDQPLGHQEQADTFDTGRRIGQAGEHQMDDVVR